MSLCHQLCSIFKFPSILKTKWQLTHRFKEQILAGNAQALKATAINLEFLAIDADYIQLRIKVMDQNGDGISFIDFKDTMHVGATITLLDLNHAIEFNIT